MQDRSEAMLQVPGNEVLLSDIRRLLKNAYPDFEKAVLNNRGITQRRHRALSYSLDEMHSQPGLSADNVRVLRAAEQLLDQAVYRRRDRAGPVSWVRRLVLVVVAGAVLSMAVLQPVVAETSPNAEKWYTTAISWATTALEWMKVVQEGLGTVTKGLEYATKVIDNQMGSLFDLQTEQYTKSEAAAGTRAEALMVQLENQQKAWVRLGSRPGGNVCVDGAVYGGWLGLQQSAANAPGTNIEEPGTLFEDPTNGKVVADFIGSDYESLATDAVRFGDESNTEHQKAIKSIASATVSVDAAADSVRFVENSSKKQNELGQSEFDAAKLLRNRLSGLTKEPESNSKDSVVADNRLTTLAGQRLNLLDEMGIRESMSRDELLEFQVRQYTIPGFVDFVNSSGAGPEPLLRELIGMMTVQLQLDLENLTVNKRILEVQAKSELAKATSKTTTDELSEAYQSIRYKR